MHHLDRERQQQELKHYAFSLGAHAGRLRLPPSVNPFRDDDPLRQEWERARFSNLTQGLRRSA